MKTLVGLVVLAALSAGPGCSDNSVEPDEFLDAYRSAYCRWSARCGAWPNRATCEANINLQSQRDVAQLIVFMKNGRVRLNSKLAGDCFDRLGGLSCTTDALTQLNATCDGLFTGTVDPGSPCLIREECMGGGNCVRGAACSVSSCCKGTCEAKPPRSAPGSPCGVGIGQADCTADAYCARGAGVGVCALRVGLGQPCTQNEACPAGARCQLVATSGRVCVTPAADGQLCADGRGCENTGSQCDPIDGLCRGRPAVGAPCGPNIPCVSFATCVNGVCQMRPGAGEICSPFGASTQVPDGGFPVVGPVPTTTLACLGNSLCSGGRCVPRPEATVCPM